MAAYLLLVLMPGVAPLQCALWVSPDIAWIVYGGTVLLDLGGLAAADEVFGD